MYELSWVEQDDGTLMADDDDHLYVIAKRVIPYPPGAPRGLKLLTGVLWELHIFVRGRCIGPPRQFTSLRDAQHGAQR